ncbi:hypothetical protein NKH77_11090 [Streptomyces sp. M19]
MGNERGGGATGPVFQHTTARGPRTAPSGPCPGGTRQAGTGRATHPRVRRARGAHTGDMDPQPAGTDRRGELADFLRSLRSRLTPTGPGCPRTGAHGGCRAAPRRGRPPRRGQHRVLHPPRTGPRGKPVPEVLDALARALRLDAAEREHLLDLAARRPAPSAAPRRPQRVRPGCT